MREAALLFTSNQPDGTSASIFVPEPGRTYMLGTTVPALGTAFALGRGGLHVPEHLARGPVPLDVFGVWLTAEEVLGQPFGLDVAIHWLEQLNLEAVVLQCSALLGRLESAGADWKAINLELARSLLQEPYATRTADLVAAGGSLVAPQSILILLKLALRHGQRDSGAVNAGLVLGSLLAIQQVTMAPDEPSEDRRVLGPSGSLFREIVSNQMFAVRPTEASLIARLQVRWKDLPLGLTTHPEYVDLPAEFARATGTTIDDLTALGLALWARSVEQPGVPFQLSYLGSFKWTSERLEAALALIVADAPTLLTEADRGDKAFGVTWSFDAFRRYPVIRLSGDRLLVISPSFLLARLFAWLPLYDLKEGLTRLCEGSLWSRIDGFFRHVCEVHALETVAATIGETPLLRRMYRQEDLQAAFGADKKTADAAIDYGDAWVVVEVSTHQLTRPASVGGRATALEEDFRIGVIEKVEQLDSTISELLADESRLTHAACVPRRRILVVLVSTEGF